MTKKIIVFCIPAIVSIAIYAYALLEVISL
jgi:hypothetical protein